MNWHEAGVALDDRHSPSTSYNAMYGQSSGFAHNGCGTYAGQYQQPQQEGMAGVGARRMMQKQERLLQRQRQAEIHQQQAREEETLERHRREEDRRQQAAMAYERQQYEAEYSRRRQQQQQQEVKHSQRANDSKQDRSYSEKAQPAVPTRQHTDSQITARQEDYPSSDYADQSSMPDGFGGLISASSADSDAYTRANPAKETSSDDVPRSRASPMPRDQIAFTSSPRPVVRDTVYELLPKATCADCGEKLPFDDLVDHTCVGDACRSPLLIRGPDSLNNLSSSLSPVEATTPSLESSGRSPFFDRYEKVQREYDAPTSSNCFLTPAMTPSARSTPSPYMRQAELTPILGQSMSAHSSPMMRSSPLLGLGTDAFDRKEGTSERAHALRKRQIEEQRAAARSAAMTRAPTPNSSTFSGNGLGLTTPGSSLCVTKDNRTHRRADPGSCSSASTVSTKSSSSSFFNRASPDTLTPSSSNEQVSNVIEKPVRYKPQGSPSKRFLDLQDIEGLVREIENSPTSPNESLPPQSRTSPALPRSKADVRYLDVGSKGVSERKMEAQSKQQQQESLLRSRNRRPSNAARPLMMRARTKDRVDNKLCSVCLKAFEKGQPMVQRDGKILCLDDYAELYLEKCRKCKKAVRTVGVRSLDGALPGLFHRECFSCLQCDASFDDGTFYVYDGAPYCRAHYHRLNGTECVSCHDGIEGQCRQLSETGERFHIHCLTCQFDDGREFCKDLLGDYYVHAGKRLCQWHFERVMDAKRSFARRQQAAYNRDVSPSFSSSSRRGDRSDADWDAVHQAEIRAARRTTYIRTVATRKARV